MHPAIHTRSGSRLWIGLGMLALFLSANAAVAWFCSASILDDLTDAVELAPAPRRLGRLRCLLAVIEVNVILAFAFLLFVLACALERGRRARIGLPGSVSEQSVFNPSRRGVVLIPDRSASRPRRTFRLDPRARPPRPSRRVMKPE